MILENIENQLSLITEEDEAIDVDWDFGDLSILKPADKCQQGQSGSGPQEGCPIIPVGNQNKQSQKSQNGQQGQQSQQSQKGQQSQQSQQGQQGQQQSGSSGSGQKMGNPTGASNGEMPSNGGQKKSGNEGKQPIPSGEGEEGNGGKPSEGGTEGVGGNGNIYSTEVFDSHDHFTDGTSSKTTDQFLEDTMEEFENYTNESDPDSSGYGTDPGNMIRGKLKKIKRQKLPIERICSKLLNFKLDISKAVSKRDSYATSGYGASTMGGVNQSVFRPFRTKAETQENNSAILFFAVDTSGSITEEDYEKVYGWLNSIAKFFESSSNGGIPGRVYLLEWDSRVYTPIRRWTGQKGPEHVDEDLVNSNADAHSHYDGSLPDFRGGGGTDFQNVLDFLNKQFVVEKEGNGYTSYKFKFADDMKDEEGNPIFYIAPGEKHFNIGNEHTIRTVESGSFNPIYRGQIPDEYKFKYGDIIVDPNASKVGNVPFLLVFTDGEFGTPTDFGPLFKNNLGNILYIVTNKFNISHVEPQNFIYCDIYAHEFDKQVRFTPSKRNSNDD